MPIFNDGFGQRQHVYRRSLIKLLDVVEGENGQTTLYVLIMGSFSMATLLAVSDTVNEFCRRRGATYAPEESDFFLFYSGPDRVPDGVEFEVETNEIYFPATCYCIPDEKGHKLLNPFLMKYIDWLREQRELMEFFQEFSKDGTAEWNSFQSDLLDKNPKYSFFVHDREEMLEDMGTLFCAVSDYGAFRTQHEDPYAERGIDREMFKEDFKPNPFWPFM